VIYRDLGDRLGEASVLRELGGITDAGTFNNAGGLSDEPAGQQQALALFQQALQLAREVNSPLNEARALDGAARYKERAGQRTAALADLREAVAIYQRIGAAEAGPASAFMATLED